MTLQVTSEDQAWEILAAGGYQALAMTIFHPDGSKKRANASEAAAIDYLCKAEGYGTTNDMAVVEHLHETVTPMAQIAPTPAPTPTPPPKQPPKPTEPPK